MINKTAVLIASTSDAGRLVTTAKYTHIWGS